MVTVKRFRCLCDFYFVNITGLSDHFETDPIATMLYRNPLTEKVSPGTVTFKCTLHRRPFTTVPTIGWQRLARNRTKKIVNKRSSRFFHFQSGMTSHLQITNPRSSDFQSQFRCIATHSEVTGFKVLSQSSTLSTTGDICMESIVVRCNLYFQGLAEQ